MLQSKYTRAVTRLNIFKALLFYEFWTYISIKICINGKEINDMRNKQTDVNTAIILNTIFSLLR